jgi:hypothetical protein
MKILTTNSMNKKGKKEVDEKLLKRTNIFLSAMALLIILSLLFNCISFSLDRTVVGSVTERMHCHLLSFTYGFALVWITAIPYGFDLIKMLKFGEVRVRRAFKTKSSLKKSMHESK